MASQVCDVDSDVAGAGLDALHGDGDVAPDGEVVGLDEGDEAHPVVLRLQMARQSDVGDLKKEYAVLYFKYKLTKRVSEEMMK